MAHLLAVRVPKTLGLLPTDCQMKPDILQLVPDYWKAKIVLRVGLQSQGSQISFQIIGGGQGEEAEEVGMWGWFLT